MGMEKRIRNDQNYLWPLIMAGFDYISCAQCGRRLIYDGNETVRNYLHDANITKGLTCDKCVERLKKKILDLQRHDKRRH